MRTPQLRVLLYHDVPPQDLQRFSVTLQWLQRSWDFITPAAFEAVMQGREALDRDSLLLTFDDGFASNRMVAEQVLGPLGISALFFVVTEFIAQPSREAARDYICRRLKVSEAPCELPVHLTNMGWQDLRKLLALGHCIGAHTASHERLIGSLSLEMIQREIISGADQLERELGTCVRHFAFPFGDFASFSVQAMAVAMQRFNFIYSGLRGNNYPACPCHAVRRESLTPADHHALVGAFLAGASDFRYRGLNTVLDQWSVQQSDRS